MVLSKLLFTVNSAQIWLSPDPASDTCVPLMKSISTGLAGEGRKEGVGHRSVGIW